MNRNTLSVLAFTAVFLSACASASHPELDRKQDRQKIASELDGEMSLKSDREELKELRKDIPPEKRKANDELALFLDLMRQGTEQPATVRDRFTSLVARKRSDFRTKVERLRQDYREAESRRREDFARDQEKKRQSFLSSKRSSKEIQRFSSDQEKDRVRFYADERDRRQNFESEISARSRDFDSYMREKQNEFNEQYRLYSKKFSEKPKEKKAVTGDDFRRLDEMPTQPLGPEETP